MKVQDMHGSHVSTASLGIVGMQNPDCAVFVRAQLLSWPGVVEADVSFEGCLAVVRYDPGRADVRDLMDAVGRASRLTGHRLLAVPVRARFRPQ